LAIKRALCLSMEPSTQNFVLNTHLLAEKNVEEICLYKYAENQALIPCKKKKIVLHCLFHSAVTVVYIT